MIKVGHPISIVAFPSSHHPGDTSFTLVVARAQAQPVALALIAVLVVSFVVLMQGSPVLGTLAWAAPLAYAVAAGWSLYELRRRPAEIVLRGGFAAVRSVWDVARRPDPASDSELRLYRVFPPNRVDGELSVGIGHQVYTLRPEDWPKFGRLKDALHAAAMTFATTAE